MIGRFWTTTTQWVGKHPSKAAWILIILGFLGALAILQPFRKSNFIKQDVISYYSYVPAVFVHQDIGMNYCFGNAYYQDKNWGKPVMGGMGHVQKYTMGMAVMYTPGFIVGHAHAKLGGWTADGYTFPYLFWMQMFVVGYFMIGLWFLRKILLRVAGEWATAGVLIGISFGTNILYYILGDPGMPHASVFMLVCLLMWFSIRFYETPSWRISTAIALAGSLICLIRPNHLILWGIPLLYGVYSWASLKERLSFWRIHWPKFISWGIIGIVVLAPQLMYWKYLTGSWLYYSYGEEGFFWSKPALWQVLFSFRKGLFIYTPIMVLGAIGLFWIRKKAPQWSLAIPVVLLLTWYVLAAWWCWWYGGSYGMRAFIDVFPLLGVGLAILLNQFKVDESKLRLKVAAAVIAMLCLLNLFQAFQYQSGLLHYDAMTARSYVGIFGRFRTPDGLQDWFEFPDYEKEMKERKSFWE